MRINKGLIAWLSAGSGTGARDLPYYTEHGGVFLKDTAVLSGLGVVGANNLVIVPGYGPYIRFRGLLVNAQLPPTKRTDYSPCEKCHRPCLSACPERALVNGSYNREACLSNMRDSSRKGAEYLVMDSSAFEDNLEVSFCRECELACPIGVAER